MTSKESFIVQLSILEYAQLYENEQEETKNSIVEISSYKDCKVVIVFLTLAQMVWVEL